LISNWNNKCQKFYYSQNLRAKAWDLFEFCQDKNVDMIWIVKDFLITDKSDFYKTFIVSEFTKNNEIVALFADEAHLSWQHNFKHIKKFLDIIY
jgi:hypothetical protein